MLSIYNSLTGQKEIFKPIHPGKIGIYVCGITVYDRCHLGHARSMVAFDVIVRYLRASGYAVLYVRNITDIDDKIIARANERGISVEALTDQYIQTMHEDAKALNTLAPDIEPRAVTHIDAIIQLIEELLEKNYAYVASNQDVYFEVSQFKNYGQLSNRALEDLIAGARVEIVKEKKSPLDFVLWKQAKENEPSWPSPWGPGRPGWHIECSAMSMHELGEQFDIHGGGIDLLFPHHENEIAQSEAVSDKKFANYWMHVGLLQLNNEKMAKSTGNFLTIEEAIQKHDPETIRYFLLSSHYRSPLNYSAENLVNAHKALRRLYQSFADYHLEQQVFELAERWSAPFHEAMNDDFNTPTALSILFQLSHELNKTRDPALAYTLKKLADILGLLQSHPESFLNADISTEDRKEIEALIAERSLARTAKDWQKSDDIRDNLAKKGIELKDNPEGTRWRKVD